MKRYLVMAKDEEKFYKVADFDHYGPAVETACVLAVSHVKPTKAEFFVYERRNTFASEARNLSHLRECDRLTGNPS